MSGGLFTNILAARDRPRDRRRARRRSCGAPSRRRTSGASRMFTPLPGARDLLAYLTDGGIPWAIATSGRMETARSGARAARRSRSTRADRHARPGAPRQARSRSLPRGGRAPRASRSSHATVVGDSVWDMLAAQRARALGIGLLSGGYGARRARARRRLSRVRRSGRDAGAPRRARRPRIAPTSDRASHGCRCTVPSTSW